MSSLDLDCKLDEKYKQIEEFFNYNNYCVSNIDELSEKMTNILYKLILENNLNQRKNVNLCVHIIFMWFAILIFIIAHLVLVSGEDDPHFLK